MQKYKPKTPLANVSDRVLRVMITCGLGIGWFVYLWGMRLTALTAGVAFGGLLWLCARQFGKKSMMRRIIGGELALGRLLLMPPRHAAFQAALWVSPRVPVRMQRALDWGVTGTLEDKPVLVRLIAQHESIPVTVQQVVEAAREMRALDAQSLILCLTAPATREALTYAAGFDPPIRVISRQEMIDLAGLCSPATDVDLSRLGRRKKARSRPKDRADLILAPSFLSHPGGGVPYAVCRLQAALFIGGPAWIAYLIPGRTRWPKRSTSLRPEPRRARFPAVPRHSVRRARLRPPPRP